MNRGSPVPQRVTPPKRSGVALGQPSSVSFSARFCKEHNCEPGEFVTAVLKHCIARRALPIFLLIRGSRLFALDRELIASIAAAVTMDEVRDAIDDFWDDSANQTWLRRLIGLRVSTRRLRRLVSEYLPFTRRIRAQRGRMLPPRTM